MTFPMFSKIDVNGENRHPLYAKLVAAAPTAVAPEAQWLLRAYGQQLASTALSDDILNFENS